METNAMTSTQQIRLDDRTQKSLDNWMAVARKTHPALDLTPAQAARLLIRLGSDRDIELQEQRQAILNQHKQAVQS